jgi:hypothetical protein
MSRSPSFTQAQVRRAVKAAESAGLRVRRITVKPDGSIMIDSGENEAATIDSPKLSVAASWDDA